MRKFTKNCFIPGISIFIVLFMFSICFAFGGKVSYPNGTPAAGAKVSLIDKDGGKKTVICNAKGQFQFAQLPSDKAEIQIKASNGRDYAKVKLPASVFTSGNVAIVLQPKKK